jgi:hypothetical protein
VKGILKLPLIVAAAVVVLRVVVERMGVAENISNLLSVVMLHLLIGPLYFAIRIVFSGVRSPYTTQIKLVALYVVLTRAMILPTYWLARIYGWDQSRFGGLHDASPLVGFVAIPFQTAGMWVVASLVVGSALGVVVIFVMSRFLKSNATALLS